MTNRRTVGLMVAGAAMGVFGNVLFGGHMGTLAQAQTPPAGATAAVGRYQLSAYGYGMGNGGAGSRTGYGAYVLDTQTGEVFAVEARGDLTSIGSVGKK
ncbi:hypothetical protein [Limnoglobus roseus]|uniref:Uncharacterized protein n=1 Tax=Limnoglobus roseus TaxID=2598579 RepID=A0A5C1AKP2_9BACT|nr:hypothetical protein [Limnoglobus roseus]QEL19235.1 hypothetical protein PX52LOC_06297 [Limnoglobus roseus]